METKGFMVTLSNLEANGIKVDIKSTDRHPQIKKEIRVNHPNIDHQFDPWHISKSVSKKLAAASKKSGCSDLAPWIPSIVNHLWWSAESCGNDPEVLKEKWFSFIHHVTNTHEWPGHRHFHKCEHNRLSTYQQQKKKWLKPGSASHTALVNTVKDIVHLTKFVHTAALEIYHSFFLKRASFCKYRKSRDSFKIFDFFLFSPKKPFSELFSKTELKYPKARQFY